VVWSQSGSSGGGGGTGSGLSITFPSGSTVQMSTTNGVSTTGSFTLTNNTSGAISYSFSSPSYSNGSGWLSFISASAGTIQAGQQVSIVVGGNPTGQPNGTLAASFSITYNGGGNGTIPVSVQFNVSGNAGGGGGGSGSGTDGALTVSPNTVSWTYTTGGSLPATTALTVTDSATTIINYTVNTATNGGFLLNAGPSGTQQTQGQTTPGTLYLYPLTNIQSLSAGTYQETININDNFSESVQVTVTLTVNGGSGGGGGTGNITMTPAPIQLSAAVGQSSLAQTTVTLTSPQAGTVNLSVFGTGLTLASNSTTQQISVNANQSTTFTVYGNAAALSANTYFGSVTAILGSLSAADSVDFVVGGSSGGGTTSTTVGPPSLQFVYQSGGSSSSLVAQQVTVSAAGTYTVNSVTPSSSWLTVTPTSGTGPGTIFVSVNPGTLAVGSYTGSFVVVPASGNSQTVNVSFQISSSTVVFPVNQNTSLSYTSGNANPTGGFTVIASDGSSIPITGVSSSQSWLTVQQQNSNTPALFSLTVNAASLANGVNTATVTITSNAANPSLVVPVTVNVSGSSSGGSGVFTVSPTSLSLSASTGSSQSSTVTLVPSVAATYSATATSTPSGWLTVSPSSGGLSANQSLQFTVTANATGLATGTYSGTVSFSVNGSSQSVPVTFAVNGGGSGGGGGTGAVTLSPTSLSFGPYTTGGTVPSAQGFNVTGTSSNSSSISYTVQATTANGGNWLLINSTSGFTPGAVNVSIDPNVVATLAAGTYTGTVTVTPSGGTAASVAITLTVQGLPTISASPTNLSLSYQVGNTNTPTGTIQVSGSAANLNFTANATSAGWLQVSPTSGTTGTNGASLSVTVNPAGLGSGNYTGTIVVSGTSGATGTSTITVTLAVTAPLPTISAVVNAASGASGAVSPGEIVSIFGPASNPIGPSTPATLTLNPNGTVATTLGGVQVLFNGIPAPLTYVSSTQINCVVPYGIAGLFAPFVQVKFQNQNSNSFSLTTTSTAPGIFTQNGSGTGPGAILNQDNSTNGPGHGAVKGSVVVIYMTGEGQTTPAGVTGSVTCSTCTIAQLPVPLLPVTVTFIDSNNVRYPANFLYAGEAPGFVAGVMQVDAVLPANVPSGTLQVVVGVGSNTSQSGVTVTVQ
jgi:uncharacterized protein (TIGR03437 family)